VVTFRKIKADWVKFFNKEVILNGKKLNILESFIFERTSNFIDFILWLPGIMVFTYLYTYIHYRFEIGFVWFGLIAFMMVVVLLFYSLFVYRYMYKEHQRHLYKYNENIDEYISSSWIVNSTMIFKAIYNRTYRENDKRLEYLKKCYGHELFEMLKSAAFEDDMGMVSYIENPSKEKVNAAIIESSRNVQVSLFKTPFTFSKYDLKVLKKFYAQAKGIKDADKFAWACIDRKSAQELAQELNRDLVLKN